MKKAVRLLLACLAGLWSATLPATAAVIDSVNADKQPAPLSWWAGQDEVGWLYRPASAYDLTGVETRFGALRPSDGNFANLTPTQRATVTVEVYDALPADGGHLLRSADFTASTELAGGVFPALQLVAGEDYFIGFRHLDGLGVNYTIDPGAKSLGADHVELGNIFGFAGGYNPGGSGTYSIVGPASGRSSAPILRFLGEPIPSPTTAPEPAGVLLLGLGALPLLKRRVGRGGLKAA